VGVFSAGSLLTALVFAAVAAIPSKGLALIILGLTPFLALALPGHARLNVARPAHAVVAGVVCMALQLVAGVSGPILDTFFIQSGPAPPGLSSTKAPWQ